MILFFLVLGFTVLIIALLFGPSYPNSLIGKFHHFITEEIFNLLFILLQKLGGQKIAVLTKDTVLYLFNKKHPLLQ
ncbi:hypothetical protein ROZALSC1DRAFT_26980, partial [Rozella allomycis CSF55]